MKISKLLFAWIIFLAAMLLNGCSSEETVFNTPAANDTTGNASFTITTTLKDGPLATDSDTTTFTLGSPGYLTFTVVDANGDAAANQILTVSASQATVNASSLLTDASGIARTELVFNGSTDAGTAVVTLSTSDGPITDSINYQATAPAGTPVTSDFSISMTLKDGPLTTDNDIIEISPVNPGYLTFTVVDEDGDPAPEQIVAVNTSLALVNPSSYLTDASGVAQTTLVYNGAIGADTISASVTANGETYSTTKNYAVKTTGTSISSSLSINITLKDGPVPTDTDITQISQNSPGYLTISVVDEDGAPAVNQLVSITTSLGLVFPATYLTDASGSVQTTLVYNDVIGADSLSASVSLSGVAYSQSINYEVTSTGATEPSSLSISMALTSDVAGTNSITEISPDNPGYLTLRVVDKDSVAAANQLVTVSTTLAQVNPATYLTNAQGEVQTRLEYVSGNVGADTVNASVSLNGQTYSSSLNYAVTSSSLSIALALKDATDADVTVISADSPGYLTVSILDENGVAVAGQIATVTTTLADVSLATVLTNASGTAQTRLDYLSLLGADEIVVTAVLNGISYTTRKNYAVVAPSINLGDNSGASFVSGQLELSITTPLSAGGSASVSAYVVDDTGTAFTTPVDVSFTTYCASLPTPLSSIDEIVTTSSGIASATYQANGCIGEDTITATMNFGGAEFSASATINVEPSVAGSIKFVSATPETITLQGAGGAGLQETSEVRFQVVDTFGQPMKGQSVTFSANGSAGGHTIITTEAVTNAEGEVFTVVQAGSIPFVVVVVATVELPDGTIISTQSSGLEISAGLPDHDSFTISASSFNPEALRYNGEEVTISVSLADIYNNPPPEKTSVYFTTEGGKIDQYCLTNKSGSCSVIWSSANPRPADNIANDYRATVLAYTQGVESFKDLNGDGRFSDTEDFTDLPDVFRDDDEDNSYDIGEFFVDFDNNAAGYEGPDGEYNGNLCNDSARCSSQTTINLSRDLVIVFSDSFARIRAEQDGDVLATINYDGFVASGNTLDTTPAKVVEVTFSDTNGEPLPEGTEIRVESEAGTVSGTTLYTQPSTNIAGDSSFFFTVRDADEEEDNDPGRLTITVETPKGNKTEIYFNVDDVPAVP